MKDILAHLENAEKYLTTAKESLTTARALTVNDENKETKARISVLESKRKKLEGVLEQGKYDLMRILFDMALSVEDAPPLILTLSHYKLIVRSSEAFHFGFGDGAYKAEGVTLAVYVKKIHFNLFKDLCEKLVRHIEYKLENYPGKMEDLEKKKKEMGTIFEQLDKIRNQLTPLGV